MRLGRGLFVILPVLLAFLPDEALSLIDGSGILLTPVLWGTGSSLAAFGLAGIVYSVAVIMIGLVYIKEPSEEEIYAEIYDEERKRKQEAQAMSVIPPWFYNMRYPSVQPPFYPQHPKKGQFPYPNFARRRMGIADNETQYVTKPRNKGGRPGGTISRRYRGMDKDKKLGRRLDRLNVPNDLNTSVDKFKVKEEFQNEECREKYLCLKETSNQARRRFFK